MHKKGSTIYEYFPNYSESQIDEVISKLEKREKLIISARFDNDLRKVKTSKNWDSIYHNEFYNEIIPIMKAKLVELENQAKEVEKNNYIQYLLDSIRIGRSNKEICDFLNISYQKLYEDLTKLRNYGVSFSKNYYYNGLIKYESINNITGIRKNKELSQEKTLIISDNLNKMKFLVISDLHFGNELERIDLINRAFNYCTKNNIYVILCGGDFIDGTFTKGKQIIPNIYEQIDYFLKNYPNSNNIITFGVAGDHDMSALRNYSIDIVDACEHSRHDIIIGSYNNLILNVKNDMIHLFHHIDSGGIRDSKAPIILHGHNHVYSTSFDNDRLNIILPSLSDIGKSLPSALELEVEFINGFINYVIVKQIYFGNDDIILSENVYDLLSDIFDFNEEDFSIDDENPKSNQILKFNKKYGF